MTQPSTSAWPRSVIDETAVLRDRLDRQEAVLTSLRDEIAELRALVGRGQSEALRRIDELRGNETATSARSLTVPTSPKLVKAAPSAPFDCPVDRAPPITGAEYARLVTRIRALVRTVVPGDAVVAVVSRGDDALVDLDGRTGWHFPRCDDGRYLGHHPQDGAAAVAHLRELRRRGARYLLFPATALWWLTYYDDLRRHLDDECRLVVRRDDACVIYALASLETP